MQCLISWACCQTKPFWQGARFQGSGSSLNPEPTQHGLALHAWALLGLVVRSRV